MEREMKMEQYQALIGVVLEKMTETYKDLKYNYESLDELLLAHSPEELSTTPELITIQHLRDGYRDMMTSLESRFPGIKE